MKKRIVIDLNNITITIEIKMVKREVKVYLFYCSTNPPLGDMV